MKKAQGLPITIIIVAAIALVVFVVLLAIFTGKMGGLQKVSPEAQAELERLKLRYGECAPNEAEERAFLVRYSQAANETVKYQEIDKFKKLIDECKAKSGDACTGRCRLRGRG